MKKNLKKREVISEVTVLFLSKLVKLLKNKPTTTFITGMQIITPKSSKFACRNIVIQSLHGKLPSVKARFLVATAPTLIKE